MCPDDEHPSQADDNGGRRQTTDGPGPSSPATERSAKHIASALVGQVLNDLIGEPTAEVTDVHVSGDAVLVVLSGPRLRDPTPWRVRPGKHWWDLNVEPVRLQRELQHLFVMGAGAAPPGSGLPARLPLNREARDFIAKPPGPDNPSRGDLPRRPPPGTDDPGPSDGTETDEPPDQQSSTR